MDEQHLIIEEPFSIGSFFAKVIHRFKYGNTPFNGSVMNIQNSFSSSWGLGFDSHPGSIDEAIIDSKNLNRSLFVFVYCLENPLTHKVINVFLQQSVSDEIRQHFIFLPLDCTTVEGFNFANSFEFHSLPMIALIRPRGNTLSQSQVFVKHEGYISESVLLSFIRVENRAPQTEVQQQDDEFSRALVEEQERQRRAEEEEELEKKMKRRFEEERDEVEKAFQMLPDPSEISDRCTIKFQLPNNQNMTHSFPRDGQTKMLYTFIRKYMFPKQFQLSTGYPPKMIDDTDSIIKDVCKDKQFIIYVQEI